MPVSSFKALILFCMFSGQTYLTAAQTQEEFDKKLTEIYTVNTTDKKKALAMAKELYNAAEKKKDLQTITNYYMLKNLFENITPDAALAKTCADKADRLTRESVGKEVPKSDYGSDSMNLWYNTLYPGLYETRDPENALKALAFLEKYRSFQNLANYSGIAYAFERNGDFDNARKYYEYSLQFAGDEKKEHVSYLYYILFLTKAGDYQKAEGLIKKIEGLALTASSELLKTSYRNEALSAHTLYYYYVGDYESYVQSSHAQFTELSKLYSAHKMPCTGQEYIRLTNAAVASEFLKDYHAAGQYWKSRDSAYTAWIKCQKEQYPNLKLYEFSMWPVFLLKRGKNNLVPKPLEYYIEETENYYNSFDQYADLSIRFYQATHLAFLKSPKYRQIFLPILDRIRNTRDFRESTRPFNDYAYFLMRDRNWNESKNTYQELYTLNSGWINDIIFTFGEKAFVTYYNAKLKDGYENFHSFVKLAKEKQPALFPELAGQAYNNLLFTKSISLQGTKKRKEAFIRNNDRATIQLYEKWLDKKQQLIREYFKSTGPASIPVTGEKAAPADLKSLQDEVAQMENQLAAQSKDYKKLLKITPPGWKDIQAKLKEGEAAVEIIRFQWRDQVYYSDTAYYAAYIITKNSLHPEVVYLPGAAADLDNKYYKLYKNNIRFKLDDKDSYNHYWKPVQEKLTGIGKVFLSPDGIYHLINISTLKNPVSGKYVLDETEIRSAVSTGDIALASASAKAISTAVLIGRPSYKISGTLAATPPADETTRSFVSNFRDNNIADLPGTEEEVMTIKKEMEQGKVMVTYYLKEKATEDKIYQLHSPGVLHIATHGYWSGTGEKATDGYRHFNAMVNSGLLLSGVVNYYSSNEYPDTYDGVLTAYEAQNLDLQNTSLVVLSACETTLGYLDAGEGVYGLQRAFRAAGAGSIMTSLWKVDDNATKDFMIAFYRHYLKTNNKGEAFTIAQKAIRQKYVQPYYWGAFVLAGE
jgi:CHAT domain-containing protein